MTARGAPTQPCRLPRGGRIDRTRPVRFRFNGEPVEGYAGDTIASALLANDIALVGRSFKYHRPRGILSHGSDEPNALLDVDRGRGRREPNNRATMVAAVDRLEVRSQNHWPSLQLDVGRITDLLAPLLAAGFYYKTFMWPRAFWHSLYEPAIRAVAGLGVAPADPDADRYAHRHAHCDVLIVGAGPAGLAAALAAAETGQRVIVADEQSELGGSLLHDLTSTIDGLSAEVWAHEAIAALASRDNVTLLPSTTAFASYNHNFVAMVQRLTDHLAAPAMHLPRERLWQVRAREVVLATGAHERPLTFPNNDRPGIMLAESIRAYINRFSVVPGRSIVFVASGASAYRAAADARAAGVAVTMVDVRPDDACGPECAWLRTLGVEVLTGHAVLGSTGSKRVSGLVVAPLDQAGRIGSRRVLRCDAVGLSGGWTPAVHLFSQSRGKLAYRPDIDAFVPDRPAQAVRCVGAARGTYDLAAVLAESWHAGTAVAGSGRERRFAVDAIPSSAKSSAHLGPAGVSAARGPAFVDFQNDVTAKDIELAAREGFRGVEHVKRYTTTGMATDQGKTSNMAALRVLSATLDRPMAALGVTTFRPPFTPVTFGALAGPARGDLFDPIRTTPTHDWAEAHGARFEPVGRWRRAWYFPRHGEDMPEAVRRECRAVRASVGMLDASTLGKIEVVGPDAAEFMNGIYINDWSGLQPGRCRYGAMLKEDGFIFDDGVVARLAPDRFHVTTTTGGAARVLAHMEEYIQTEWSDLEVYVASITEQWGVIAVQGPKARGVIGPLVAGLDLSPETFPHMAIREGTICGVPTRLFRVSFTGELGYEINVPADYTHAVWEAIYERGRGHGITPYGTETMHVLRAERGFIIVGQETDGTVTPHDVGLGAMISGKKPDFVGKRSLARPDMLAPDRKQLVGLLTEDPGFVLDHGAQVVVDRMAPRPVRALGHVTSSYWSEACGRSIALALVAGGRTRIGQMLHVTTSAGFAAARVTAPVFFDPKGEAQKETSPVADPLRLPQRKHALPLARVDRGAAISIAPLGASARFSLRVPPADAGRVKRVAGYVLDGPLNTMHATGEQIAARLGPDEWLLIGPEEESGMLRGAIAEGLGGCAYSLVDVSHGRAGIAVEGRHAHEVLASGVPIDLEDAAFPPGSATRTVLAKAEIVLMKYTAERYRVECFRSYARYVRGFLVDAASEFAAPQAG